MALSSFVETKEIEDEDLKVDSAENKETEDEEEIEAANGCWADSIAKVLSTTKPKTKKTLVLSRAKKLKANEVKKKTPQEEFGFEVAEAEHNDNKKEEEKPNVKEIKQEKHKDIKPKNLKLPLRVKASWKDIERERAFKKVATKGVVQLFNAVRVQQKELQNQLEAAGPLDSRREAVLNNIDKRKFLDVLMSGTRAKSENIDGKVKKEEESTSESDNEANSDQESRSKKKKWSVLDDDFLTNKKAKHWDEEDSHEESDPECGSDE